MFGRFKSVAAKAKGVWNHKWNKSEETIGETIVETGKYLVGFSTAMVFLENELCFITLCTGPSMMPTINKENDLIFVLSNKHFGRPYQNDDIVVATPPNDHTNSKYSFVSIILLFLKWLVSQEFAKELEEWKMMSSF